MFFELVSILFAIVPDHGNEYTTKKLNLNHNIYLPTQWLEEKTKDDTNE